MTKRLRIFAGPNGSGKSTLFTYIKNNFGINTGIFVNADEIYISLSQNKFLDLNVYGITTNINEFSEYYSKHGLSKLIKNDFIFKIAGNILNINYADSYISALITDFVRNKMIDSNTNTFSTETVFSHISKIDLIEKATSKEYNVYLYFISTNDPVINEARVSQRTKLGGHFVSPNKINDRYYRSLENLYPSLKYVHRAYIFDNSDDLKLIAEITPKHSILLRNKETPKWFDEYVIKKV